jgi:hypothetical protein
MHVPTLDAKVQYTRITREMTCKDYIFNIVDVLLYCLQPIVTTLSKMTHKHLVMKI